MLEMIVIIAAAVVFARTMGTRTVQAQTALAPRKLNPQINAAVAYADRLYTEKKWLAAEKAYVSVLKLDHKNLTAYSHLGIIYTTQKNMTDAIECFEIAVRLRPAATTYQNLAMAYHENKNYIKSIAAFEKSIMFEPSAQRYIGLSKAYKRIASTDLMISSLEKAAALDDNIRVLSLLEAAYSEAGRIEESRAIKLRIEPELETKPLDS